MEKEEFKREPNGNKEVFNETLLYELYKEYPFDSSREIKAFMLKHYGVTASANLITNITNYQIKKYGQRKSTGRSLKRTYRGEPKNMHRRERDRQRKYDAYRTKKFIETKGKCYDGFKKED